jgi:hypothetical protein
VSGGRAKEEVEGVCLSVNIYIFFFFKLYMYLLFLIGRFLLLVGLDPPPGMLGEISSGDCAHCGL